MDLITIQVWADYRVRNESVQFSAHQVLNPRAHLISRQTGATAPQLNEVLLFP